MLVRCSCRKVPRFFVKVGKKDEARSVLMNTNKGDEGAVNKAMSEIEETAS